MVAWSGHYWSMGSPSNSQAPSLVQENGVPYWYNSDTGEASFRTPTIIAEQEKFATALERGYNALPSKVMLHILSFLRPLPDRIR